MDTNEVESVFKGFCKTAEDIFYKREEVQPLIFIVPFEAGREIVVVPIDKGKEATSRLVQSLCRRTQAIAGIVICEAWMSVFDKGEKWDGTPPSERLDRVEILQALLIMKGKSESKIWKIHRENEIKSLELYTHSSDAVDQWSRFFGDYFRVDA